MPQFHLQSPFEPKGDQPAAIKTLVERYRSGTKQQCLMGVTGSGKTLTMAHVIEQLQTPTLVISHNKTLAAQLYSEFKEFFPHNAVHYFVSYYDYYQPEAYVPGADYYLAKIADVNEEIDALRHAATSSLTSREDVIVVASVSCIYGLGSPAEYQSQLLRLELGQQLDRDALLRQLVAVQYERNDTTFSRGHFRVRGDVVEIYPVYEEEGVRVEFFGDEVERLAKIDVLTGEVIAQVDTVDVFPAKHFVMAQDQMSRVVQSIEAELDERLEQLRSQGKLLEAQRLEARTKYDMELLMEVGYCPGVEEYCRHLMGSAPGQPPYTLVDYFPPQHLTILDESHVSAPQLKAMHRQNVNRKNTLVEHGFRLPSCQDNRPLKLDEFEAKLDRVLYVSATPGPYELGKCGNTVVEQVIRPTGLVDPKITLRPAKGQVADLVKEIHKRVPAGQRVLVTTLSKRMAEDLSEYLQDEGLKCAYLHCEIETMDRVEILNDLRRGDVDVIVGINLLREGLDLPEVALVAILDADKEGLFRSTQALIQTMGRAARNVDAEAILYADTVTKSMGRAIDETNRRRAIQLAYNRRHDIEPETIRKEIRAGIIAEIAANQLARQAVGEDEAAYVTLEQINELEAEMLEAADKLDFERAAELRDKIVGLKKRMGEPVGAAAGSPPADAHKGKRKRHRRKKMPWMP